MMKLPFLTAGVVSIFFATYAAATILCSKTPTPFSMTGAPSAANIAQNWADAYGTACNTQIEVIVSESTDRSGSDDAAELVCGAGGGPVDIGLLSRQLKPSEGVPSARNPYLYTCAQGLKTRQLIESQIAIDGIAFIAARNGIAASCISSLPSGGLTLSQIRWMFSNFTFAQLKVDPHFKTSDIPNSDHKDNTRLWSELCKGASCNCPATPVGIAGLATNADLFPLFQTIILTGTGETVRNGFQSDLLDSTGSSVVTFVTSRQVNPTIGFTSFHGYNKAAVPVYTASVKNPDDGIYRLPKFSSYLTGLYPVSKFLYMYVAQSANSATQRFFEYAFSPEGNGNVASTGLIQLPPFAQRQMWTRLGVRLPICIDEPCGPVIDIKCGPTGAIFQGGSSLVYPLAHLWGGVYSDYCGVNVTTVAGGNSFGAKLACGVPDPATGETADIGALSRPFKSSEAVLPAGGNGYDYKCLIGTKRSVREIPVANYGIAFAYPLNQGAAQCLASLPGKGLTVDQLRWMFSSLTTAQLSANGWNSNSLPSSDASDSTHLWSELGGSGCPKQEIAIAGSPTSSETYNVFTSAAFKANGETVALNRPKGGVYFSNENPDVVISYLQANIWSIGFVPYSPYILNSKLSTLGTAAVKNTNGVFVSPNLSTLSDGSYNPFSIQLFFELSSNFFSFQLASAYAKTVITSFYGRELARSAGFVPLKSSFITSLGPRFTMSGCFSESMTVQVLGKSVTAMKDLKLGDFVMNAAGTYDKIYSFGHHAPAFEAEFIQLRTTGMQSPLEVTGEHMLFVAGAAVPASAISIGDKLDLATNGGAVIVKSIKRVVRKGLYAPFTTSGTIAVNGIAASVYIDIHNDAGVLVMGGYKTPFSLHFLSHMFQAPHRLICQTCPTYCQSETYDERGISGWANRPMTFLEWLLEQNSLVMTVTMFIPCFVVVAIIYIVELLLSSNVWIFAVALVSAVLAVRSAPGRKENKHR